MSEVLVVLGLMVGVAALAQPALRSALGDSRLRSAARQVRAELAKTRLRAMQSGQSQTFRYQAGKNRFEIAPVGFAVGLAGQLASAREAAGFDCNEPDESASPGLGCNVVEQVLPEGICFEGVEEHLTAAVDEEGWSPPIVFQPTGRAADATIRLRGERNAVVDVALRGLTGVATAGKPRHDEATR
jgi:hypothetical protein